MTQNTQNLDLLSHELLNLPKMLCRFCGNLAVVLADFLTINVNQAQKLIDTLASLYPILAYHKTPDTLTPNFDILNTLNKQTLGSLDQKSVAPDIPTKIMDAIAKDTHLSPSTIQKGFGILIQIFDFFTTYVVKQAMLDEQDFLGYIELQSVFFTPKQIDYQKHTNNKPPVVNKVFNPAKTPLFDSPFIPNHAYLASVAKVSLVMPVLSANQALEKKMSVFLADEYSQDTLIGQTATHKWAILSTIVFIIIGAMGIRYFDQKNQVVEPQPIKQARPIPKDVAIVRIQDENDNADTPSTATEQIVLDAKSDDKSNSKFAEQTLVAVPVTTQNTTTKNTANQTTISDTTKKGTTKDLSKNSQATKKDDKKDDKISKGDKTAKNPTKKDDKPSKNNKAVDKNTALKNTPTKNTDKTTKTDTNKTTKTSTDKSAKQTSKEKSATTTATKTSADKANTNKQTTKTDTTNIAKKSVSTKTSQTSTQTSKDTKKSTTKDNTNKDNKVIANKQSAIKASDKKTTQSKATQSKATSVPTQTTQVDSTPQQASTPSPSTASLGAMTSATSQNTTSTPNIPRITTKLENQPKSSGNKKPQSKAPSTPSTDQPVVSADTPIN